MIEMHSLIFRFGLSVIILATGFALQALGYYIEVTVGDICTLLSFLLVVWAAWIVGSAFRSRYLIVAGVFAGVIAYHYVVLSRLFHFWYRVDLLENAMAADVARLFGVLSLIALAMIAICIVVAAISAFRNRT